MDRQQYSYVRELERIPRKYFIDKGCGQSDIAVHAGSFHLALQECGIENYNIVSYSSILPKECEEIKERPKMRRGTVMNTILARCDGKKGENIAAGIAIGDLKKKSNGKHSGSLVCEIGGKIQEKTLDKKLRTAVSELHKNGYADEYDLVNVRTHIQSCKVKKKHGTVLVSICFTEHEHIVGPPQIEKTNFLGIQRPYKRSEYAILPVLYDGTATYKRGSKEGPLAILDASQHLERYDIDTDCQPHMMINMHTMDCLDLEDDPVGMIEAVREKVGKIVKDKKFPITLGGGHGISVGAFHAMKERGEEFTILQFDAHTDLRDSYDGTEYSEACVMRRGLETTKNIVQVGIRSISNREVGVLDYDKLFLAADIKQSGDTWIDDVIEECSDNVYITFDVAVLDPSIMNTPTPEPDGLYYEHVYKMIKKLVKKRRIIGLDVNNLMPITGMNGPEFTAAKLILQFIALREKFGIK